MRGGRLGRLYARLSLRRRSGRDGWRSDVSCRLLARIAQAWGLRVVLQTQRWGEDGRFDVRRYNDWITVLASPAPAASGQRVGELACTVQTSPVAPPAGAGPAGKWRRRGLDGGWVAVIAVVVVIGLRAGSSA